MSKTRSLRRAALLTTAATSLSLLAMPAFAQDDADDDVVVVRGFKKAIQDSIAKKAESTSIVESISAEDIGKLPDASIAESLARLPGLAAQRLSGRAQVISVRGLSPDFTSALLNGREQVTAGDNRGVEFDQYPGELLSGVTVYKTPEASLIGQGLAGTADLQTIRPLAYGRRAVSVGARYEFNDQDALNAGAANDGYRFTGSWVDQNEDKTFGWVFGVALQSTPTQAERFEAWGYPNVGTDADGGEIPGSPLLIGGMKPYAETRELERDAYLGTLEWAPTDQINTSLDLFYSSFKDDGILRGIEFPLAWGGVGLEPGTYTIDANGAVSEGAFIGFAQFAEDGETIVGRGSGVQGVVRNDIRTRDADVSSAGWNFTYRPNDDWELELDVSHSRVERLDVDFESYSGTGRGFGNGAAEDRLPFMYSSEGYTVLDPSLNYADPSTILLTDPQGWGQVGFIKRPETEDELNAIRGSAKWFVKTDLIDSFDFGVYVSEREKIKRSIEDFVDLASGMDEQAVPTDLIQGSTAFEFIGVDGILSYDPEALLAAGIYDLRQNVNPDVVTKSWVVKENVLTAYVQANILTDLGDIPVRGNVGFQMVQTDQSSEGALIQSADNFLIFEDGDDYTEWLPSLNLGFEVMDDTFIRVAAARTLARARMDEMRASAQLSLNPTVCAQNADGDVFVNPNIEALSPDQVCLTTNGGDPKLRPNLAWAYDLSFEKYFADRTGYVSLAFFRKDLEDYVFQGPGRLDDFTTEALAIFGQDLVTQYPSLTIGSRSAPENTEGGYIQGIEFATNIPGELLLPAPFDGFGLFLTYSYNDSEITPLGFDPIPVPGLSENLGNITLYYEKNGFEARVSNRYRSEFLGEVAGFGANRELRLVQEENVVDAQISYSFQEGPLEGLNLLLQGQNITDEEFVTLTNGSQIRDYQQYGATYLIGARWSM